MATFIKRFQGDIENSIKGTFMAQNGNLSNIPIALGLFVRDISPTGFSIWMQKRKPKDSLSGLWEFPGGKVEAEETPREALYREIVEEVQLELTAKDPIQLFKLFPYSYKDKRVFLYSFIIEADELPLTEQQGQWHYIDYTQANPEAIPPANHAIFDELKEFLKEGRVQQLWT